MYSIIETKDIKSKDYGKWKLSFIDDIPSEEYKATPETEEYWKTQEYKDWKEKYGYSRNNPKIEYKNYPNSEYVPGEKEMYAYFSPVDKMGDVISDDADDAPYECNAGEPYDDIDGKEVEILKLPFYIPVDSFWRGLVDIDMKQPKNWAYGGNSPFTAEDINLGAVPWIFVRTYKYKYGNTGISFMAGITPEEFMNKLKEVKDLVKSNLEEDNFTVLGKSKNLWIVRNNKTYAIRGFDDLGKQQALGWYKGYYSDEYQVFETYEDDYKETIDTNIPIPENLISKIIETYL